LSRIKIKAGDFVAFMDSFDYDDKPLDFGVILGYADESDDLGHKLYKIRWFNYKNKDGNPWSCEGRDEAKTFREYYLKWSAENG